VRLKPVGHDVITRDSKASGGIITRVEIDNLVEDFKTDIMGTLTHNWISCKLNESRSRKNRTWLFFVPIVGKNTVTKNSH